LAERTGHSVLLQIIGAAQPIPRSAGGRC
jgi:hypothetical protein